MRSLKNVLLVSKTSYLERLLAKGIQLNQPHIEKHLTID